MPLAVEGVIPAAFVPITDDNSIHVSGFRDHIHELATHDGIDGILCNGHAGESYALTPTERETVVKNATDVAGETPVYSGVVGATTSEVVEDAQRAINVGADAIMVDAPTTPIHERPEALLKFYREVVKAVDVPVVAFQTAAHSSKNVPPSVLVEIADLEGVVAIKEGVWDYDLTKADARALRESGKNINYLMGNDEHLFPCYCLGVDGTVVELAAALPDLIVELYDAVQANNLQRARQIDQKLQPLLDAVYQDPKHDGSIRLKVLLEQQDRLPTALPKAPATAIPDDEVEDIVEARNALGI